jgi:uncharacterized protein with PIN domain
MRVTPMPVKFVTEATLGKLTKWLRLLGFDTRNVSGPMGGPGAEPTSDCFRLTRTRKRFEQSHWKHRLFIQSNDPVEQLKAVIQALDISEKDINPFSRCLICNSLIEPVAKEAVCNAVPDYVWETCGRFRQCRRCRKVYWSGSHTERGLERIKALFEKQ